MFQKFCAWFEQFQMVYNPGYVLHFFLNSKFQITNYKQIPNSNDQNEKNPKASYHAAFVLDFEHLNFEFVSDFVLRASDLGRFWRRPNWDDALAIEKSLIFWYK